MKCPKTSDGEHSPIPKVVMQSYGGTYSVLLIYCQYCGEYIRKEIVAGCMQKEEAEKAGLAWGSSPSRWIS